MLSGGVLAPNGNTRYVAIPDGPRTVIAQILVRNGFVLRSMTLDGRYGVPQCHERRGGRRALVQRPGARAGCLRRACRAGLAPSRFAAVDIKRWRPGKVLRLHGDLSVDALSPKGRMLYLIEHTSPKDYNRYRVRAYDLAYGRMLSRVIVDRRVPDEKMAGTPVTRATSPGGTWVYTLYLRQNGTGFVHALNTRRAEAVCIDLPWRDMSAWSYDVRLWVSRDGRLLHLRQLGVNGRTAAIDTRSWKAKVSSLV